MTITTSVNKIIATGDAIQVDFPYDFIVLAESHMNVYLDGVLEDTANWSMTGLGVQAGGVVTMTSAPADTVKVTLLRIVPNTQLVDYSAYGSFPAETHERALDLRVMEAQQIQEEVGRSIRFSVDTEADFDATFPSPIPGRAWKISSDGLGVVHTAVDVDEAVADSQARAWEAEAAQMTADSYATEPEGTVVKVYTSDGDGTFTATPTSDYSALHWAANAVPVSSMYALTQLDPSSVPAAAVLSFYSGETGGRGAYVYDAAYDKALANGGTIIDPDTLGGWLGAQATIAATYYGASGQGTGVGTGCWVLTDGLVDVTHFGALGDGVVDDTKAVQESFAALGRVELGSNDKTFLVSSTVTSLDGQFHGTNTLKTSDGTRGRKVRRLLAPPAVLANGSSVTTFYNNFEEMPDSYDIVVTGATSVGAPATGYAQYDNAHPRFYGAYFASGHNQSTTNADGRTGWAVERYRVQQAGDGDCGCVNMNVVVSNNDPSHTGLFGKPAGFLSNGNVTAAIDSVYLQATEYNLQDKGFDCRCAGHIVNLERDADTATFGEWWCGVRVQSTGTKEIDAAYQATGNCKIVLDTSVAHLTTDAIAMGVGQKIHFDAVPYSPPTASGTRTYASTFGNSYIYMNVANLDTVHKGVIATSISASSILIDNHKLLAKSVATTVQSISTTTSLTGLSSVVLIDATATNPTITLPSAVSYGANRTGRITLKRTGAGGTVTISRGGTDTIIDKTAATVASFALAANTTIELVCDGASVWHIL